jgi:regulator of sirC expression with transglutaminase-like and TPR domain
MKFCHELVGMVVGLSTIVAIQDVAIALSRSKVVTVNRMLSDQIVASSPTPELDQAIRLNPNNAKAYYNRGIARYSLGDKQGAIADLNPSNSFRP